MSRLSFDAIVVGGGIVGCACASALSLELGRVALVEPGPIGGGATAAGMGHLVVLDDSPAQLALTRYSQDLWAAVQGELPAACEFEVRGTLWLATNEEEYDAAKTKQEVYKAAGLEAQLVDRKTLADLEPNLRPGLAGGLKVARDAVIFPMPAARWLFEQGVKRGLERFKVAAIALTESFVQLADTRVLESSVVVNATGDLARELSPEAPIEPRKGHLAITDRHPGFVRHQLVELGYLKSAHGTEEESVAFNVQPRATGQLLIGSSRQFVGWDSETDRQILAKMLRAAIDNLPGLANLSAIRTWTGFRAATPDKLPLIGRGPGGTWLATGHEGLGITTSLATGRILADLVAGREPAIAAGPYDPMRFNDG